MNAIKGILGAAALAACGCGINEFDTYEGTAAYCVRQTAEESPSGITSMDVFLDVTIMAGNEGSGRYEDYKFNLVGIRAYGNAVSELDRIIIPSSDAVHYMRNLSNAQAVGSVDKLVVFTNGTGGEHEYPIQEVDCKTLEAMMGQ